jgi:hypothetical protein
MPAFCPRRNDAALAFIPGASGGREGTRAVRVVAVALLCNKHKGELRLPATARGVSSQLVTPFLLSAHHV